MRKTLSTLSPPMCSKLERSEYKLKNSRFFILSLLCLSIHLKTFAWGAEGHKMTATIAFNHLDQRIKDSLQFYLGETTIQQASVWMDEMRSNHMYDEMKPWHYVDFPEGESYTPSKEANIINAINNTIVELKNRRKISKGVVALDLKILIHLLGDLHQPLHTGYAIDKGGNTIKLFYFDKELNLHKIWDTEIIVSQNINSEGCERLISTCSTDSLEKIKTPNVLQWMNETRSHLPEVYDFQNNTIEQPYLNKNTPLIETQLFKAGIRIASLLTQIFE